MSRVFGGVSEPVKQRLERSWPSEQVKPRVQRSGPGNFLRRPSGGHLEAHARRGPRSPTSPSSSRPTSGDATATPRTTSTTSRTLRDRHVDRAGDRHRRLPPVEGRAAPRCGCGRRSSRRRRSSASTSRTSRSSKQTTYPHLPGQPGRPGDPGTGSSTDAGGGGDHHRRRQPPARAHPRDVRPPVPEAGPPNGLYAIEDTADLVLEESWGGSNEPAPTPATTMSLVKDLLDGLRWEEFPFLDPGYEPDLLRSARGGRARLPQSRDHREGSQPRGRELAEEPSACSRSDSPEYTPTRPIAEQRRPWSFPGRRDGRPRPGVLRPRAGGGRPGRTRPCRLAGTRRRRRRAGGPDAPSSHHVVRDPTVRGSTVSSAQPSIARPRFSMRQKPGPPSTGGCHCTISIGSSKPTGPSSARALNTVPTPAGPSVATATRVNGTWSPCRGQSVTRAHASDTDSGESCTTTKGDMSPL